MAASSPGDDCRVRPWAVDWPGYPLLDLDALGDLGPLTVLPPYEEGVHCEA